MYYILDLIFSIEPSKYMNRHLSVSHLGTEFGHDDIKSWQNG